MIAFDHTAALRPGVHGSDHQVGLLESWAGSGQPTRRKSSSIDTALTSFVPRSARDVIRERYFPNIALTMQENRIVRLYDDLIKDKIVLINFMFTNCDRICPLVTQNLARVQRLLGERAGREVFFCLFSLDPQHDTPAVLKSYADMHNAGPGWSFVTGPPGDMEMLRRRLGFVDPDPALDADRESHIGNVRYGNEPRTLWGACPGMSSPQFIVDALGWV